MARHHGVCAVRKKDAMARNLVTVGGFRAGEGPSGRLVADASDEIADFDEPMDEPMGSKRARHDEPRGRGGAATTSSRPAAGAAVRSSGARQRQRQRALTPDGWQRQRAPALRRIAKKKPRARVKCAQKKGGRSYELVSK